ncbi:hypothetical protein [uncultured Maribacter sp.]|uniref:RipA family octameric membrane protein n=1 Tax=uncultured Maribacter sp. TaxID=431308 RepID=UPI0030EB7CA8|tara:strand:- start:11405 stop:13039 length:1635 start_codon:yes stop_codon:yes gene_type:complete
MIKEIKKYKLTIIVVSIIFITIVLFLTIDAIYETEDWKWFNVDFDKRNHVISAYGALIGGILAFLSILFVIYQVLEQREQIIQEKENSKIEKIEEQKDFLKLISSFLGSIIGDIKHQGKDLKIFYEKELLYPTFSNQTYFTVNENFNRIVEMDYMTVYRSFRHFFKDEKDWEKKFLNFYRNIDFYLKITPHLREKYSSQMDEKVKLKYSIQSSIQAFLTDLLNIRNNYILTYPIPPYNLFNFQYFKSLTDFWLDYSNYINYVRNSSVVDSDLSDLKTTYFKPLFNELLSLQKSRVPFEVGGVEKLTEDLGAIVIKIDQLEVFAKNYANDVKKYCDSYYTEDNTNLRSLIEIKELIDSTQKKKEMTDVKLEEQLKRAYELRDFEITHYWKRAQYFWGFLAVVYAGFFASLIAASKGNKIEIEFILIICSIGCIFSFAWYLVNRGSKRWQEHWENIINEIESKLNKPLYSLRPKVKTSAFNAGNFSVSRINITVSFLIFVSWILMWAYTAITYGNNNGALYFIMCLSFVSVLFVYFMGKGRKDDDE